MYDLQTMRALCRPGKRRKGFSLAKNVIRSFIPFRMITIQEAEETVLRDV
jgi:hypothetical protein